MTRLNLRLFFCWSSLVLLMFFGSTARSAEPVAAPFLALQGMNANTTIEQVAAMPADRFEVFSPKTLYKLGVDAPLWLKLQTTEAQAANGSTWLLEFPSIIVDRYEFYQRDASGQWRMVAAGDRVAHSQWPLKGLRARFALQAPLVGAQDVFIRVVHQHQTSFQPVLVQSGQASERDASQMLWIGLLLGVVFTLILTCAQMTLAYRDFTYAWYAGYLTCTMLAALCYSGIAQRVLWPDATKFASDAIVYSVMAALAFNLAFTRAMFGDLQTRWMRVLSHLLVGLCMTYMVVTVFSARYDKLILLFQLLSLCVFAFIIYTAIRAWRGGVVFGGYWLLVYVPYLLCIALTLANSAGFVNAPWLPSQTPVLAAIAEAVAMMLCINAYGRLRHAQTVREHEAALASRLARLVALGLMVDEDDLSSKPARFCISVGQRHSFLGNLSALDIALRQLLDKQDNNLRAIRFLEFEVAVRRVGSPLATELASKV